MVVRNQCICASPVFSIEKYVVRAAEADLGRIAAAIKWYELGRISQKMGQRSQVFPDLNS